MMAAKPRRAKQKKIEAISEPEVESLTRRVAFEVPIAHEAEGYATRRLDCSLSPRERGALRLLFEGLTLEGETVRGRPINRTQDAIRWLLGALADQLEA